MNYESLKRPFGRQPVGSHDSNKGSNLARSTYWKEMNRLPQEMAYIIRRDMPRHPRTGR